MEIKQHKRFFFCLYFNPVLSRNSFTTSVLQMYIGGNLVNEIQHVYCILVTSHFGYVELRITRSNLSIPLDFEITRLTCTSYQISRLYDLWFHTRRFFHVFHKPV